MLLSVFAHISDYRLVCRVSHTSCYIEPFMFSCLNTKNSSKWTACRISHAPWSGWMFLLHSLIAHSSSEGTVCRLSHILIWLPVSIVLPHRKQFKRVNRVPYITHATKIWTVFDVSAIAIVLHLFWRFFQTIVCDYYIAHCFVKGSLVIVSR